MYYIEKKFNNLYSKNKYDILQGIIKCKTEIIIKDKEIILTILFVKNELLIIEKNYNIIFAKRIEKNKYPKIIIRKNYKQILFLQDLEIVKKIKN